MVLQSDENLPLDAQMQITIGSIAIPRGSGTLAITKLTGPQHSIAIKRSLMKISNDNHMCLATAIGRCFMQLCKVVSLLEWKEISKDDDPHHECHGEGNQTEENDRVIISTSETRE